MSAKCSSSVINICSIFRRDVVRRALYPLFLDASGRSELGPLNNDAKCAGDGHVPEQKSVLVPLARNPTPASNFSSFSFPRLLLLLIVASFIMSCCVVLFFPGTGVLASDRRLHHHFLSWFDGELLLHAADGFYSYSRVCGTAAPCSLHAVSLGLPVSTHRG